MFEGARCYKTPNGSAFFRLDAHMRRLYDSARIYRMDYAVDPRRLHAGRRRHRAGQRTRRLLHPADHLSRLPHARRESAALPGRRRDSRVGMGRLPRTGRARAGRGRARELVDAQRAEHVPGDGQVGRQLRQLQPDQDGSRRSTATARASRSTRTATSAKAAARTSSSSATRSSTRRRSPRRCCPASRATAS